MQESAPAPEPAPEPAPAPSQSGFGADSGVSGGGGGGGGAYEDEWEYVEEEVEDAEDSVSQQRQQSAAVRDQPSAPLPTPAHSPHSLSPTPCLRRCLRASPPRPPLASARFARRCSSAGPSPRPALRPPRPSRLSLRRPLAAETTSSASACQLLHLLPLAAVAWTSWAPARRPLRLQRPAPPTIRSAWTPCWAASGERPPAAPAVACPVRGPPSPQLPDGTAQPHPLCALAQTRRRSRPPAPSPCTSPARRRRRARRGSGTATRCTLPPSGTTACVVHHPPPACGAHAHSPPLSAPHPTGEPAGRGAVRLQRCVHGGEQRRRVPQPLRGDGGAWPGKAGEAAPRSGLSPHPSLWRRHRWSATRGRRASPRLAPSSGRLRPADRCEGSSPPQPHTHRIHPPPHPLSRPRPRF